MVNIFYTKNLSQRKLRITSKYVLRHRPFIVGEPVTNKNSYLQFTSKLAASFESDMSNTGSITFFVDLVLVAGVSAAR